MVGGLVQDQHVRRTQQRRGQRHTLALAAGESADFLFKIRQPQPVEHGLCLIFVQGPELRREVEKHLLQHSGIILHHRVLGQETHLHIGIAGNGAVVRLRDAGQDFHKGGLSGAVDTDDAGLVPFVEIKVDIIQQLAAAEIDREMFRG